MLNFANVMNGNSWKNGVIFLAVYEYKALDEKGKELNGIVEAESRISASQALKKMALYPLTIDEATETTVEKKKQPLSFSTII